jgi:hypothetical protein
MSCVQRGEGEDYWEYLNTGEPWRQVRFFTGGVVAKYGFVTKDEAKLFDQVISSVCLLPKPEVTNVAEKM